MACNEINVYTDGGSRGNPGQSAIGIIILDKNKNLMIEHKECIGSTTNNVAEYRALVRALELAAGCCRRTINCFCDSELIVKQLNKQYKIKAPHLLEQFYLLKDREHAFDKVTYNHLKRTHDMIKKVDKLVNEALDHS